MSIRAVGDRAVAEQVYQKRISGNRRHQSIKPVSDFEEGNRQKQDFQDLKDWQDWMNVILKIRQIR